MHALCRIRILVLMLTLVSLVSCARKAKVDVAVEPSEPRTFQALEPTVGVDLEAPEVVLRQGGKVRLKVEVKRRSYQGPVALELQNLPADVTAAKVTVPAAAAKTEIELTAAPAAAPSERGDVTLVATATAANAKQGSAPIRLKVFGAPFSLATNLTRVVVPQGSRATIKVTANRQGYQGPISVELVNPPANMAAVRATIPEGKDVVDLELAAAPNTPAGDKTNVQVRGAGTCDLVSEPPLTGPSKAPVQALALSPRFTIGVAPPPFRITVEPATLPLALGGKAKLKIHADRKSYTGPIAVELRNLPAGITAPKYTIPRDRANDEVEVSSTFEVPLGARGGIQLVATATELAFQALPPPFAVNIQPGLQLAPSRQASKSPRRARFRSRSRCAHHLEGPGHGGVSRTARRDCGGSGEHSWY